MNNSLKLSRKTKPSKAELPDQMSLAKFESATDQWKRERPELDPSFFEVVIGFSLIYQQMLAEFRSFSNTELNMGEGDVRILLALRRSGPGYAQSPVSLKKNLFVTASAITKQIARLEQRGLVERTPHPTSRKSVLIHLTSKGAELVDHIHGDAQPFSRLRQAFDGLSEEEQQSGRRFLRRMMGRLESVRSKS